MKKYLFFTLIITATITDTLAQKISSSAAYYSNELELGKDLIHAYNNKDYQKLKEISQALTLPYSIFKNNALSLRDTSSLYNKNSINSNSFIASDVVQYNKYATDFYSANFILNVQNYINTFSGNIRIYVLTSGNDEKVTKEITQNFLLLVFEKEESVDVINLDKIIKTQNRIYTSTQTSFDSYDKKDLQKTWLSDLLSKSLKIYTFENNEYKPYPKILLEFDTNVPEETAIIDIGSSNIKNEAPAEITTETDILDRAEEMPSFPNGTKGLARYLKENLIYPKLAIKNKLEGKVIVKFVVDKNGSIKDPVVLKDNVGNGCAEEALRLVQKMPKWWPGKQNGKAVKVYYTLPIVFSLTD